MLVYLLVLAVLFVAFTNGANANSKGVASLYGSGICSLRTTVLWGTATTFFGSLTSIFVARGMIQTFSGRGLVDDILVTSYVFLTSVALGAAITSFLATRFGFPVSTTHALVGALVGAGLMGNSESLNLGALGKNFLYPLLLSPFIAAVLGAIAAKVVSQMKLKSSDHSENAKRRWLSGVHVLSGGASSFARGLNDTPKMAALLVVIPGLESTWALLLVGVMIAIGGIVDSRNVAETLGKKLTSMTQEQGLSANLVTAFLVTTASVQAFPVSTTHVSVGSLVGMGVSTKQARVKKVLEVFSAWLTTVPIGALFAAAAYAVLRLL